MTLDWFGCRQGGQPPRQIRAGVQEIDDDYLLGIVDKHDEVLAAAGKPQIFGQF